MTCKKPPSAAASPFRYNDHIAMTSKIIAMPSEMLYGRMRFMLCENWYVFRHRVVVTGTWSFHRLSERAEMVRLNRMSLSKSSVGLRSIDGSNAVKYFLSPLVDSNRLVCKTLPSNGIAFFLSTLFAARARLRTYWHLDRRRSLSDKPQLLSHCR